MTKRSPLTNLIIIVCASILTMASVAACDDGSESPDEVAGSFLAELSGGDKERALEMVWPETRHELLAAYDDLEAYFGGESPVERTDLLVVTRVEHPMLMSRIRVIDEVSATPGDGDEVTVKLETRGDRSSTMTLRWSDDEQRWFVDLPVDRRRALRIIDELENVESEQRQPVSGSDGEDGDGEATDEDGKSDDE